MPSPERSPRSSTGMPRAASRPSSPSPAPAASTPPTTRWARCSWGGATPPAADPQPHRLDREERRHRCAEALRPAAGSRRVHLGAGLADDWLAPTGPTGRSTRSRPAPSSPVRPAQVFATARDARTRRRRRAARPRRRVGRRRRDVGLPRPGRRRATASLLRALARAARDRGVTSLHLQTDEDNSRALALYERHGFERHPVYVNLSRPDLTAPASGVGMRAGDVVLGAVVRVEPLGPHDGAALLEDPRQRRRRSPATGLWLMHSVTWSVYFLGCDDVAARGSWSLDVPLLGPVEAHRDRLLVESPGCARRRRWCSYLLSRSGHEIVASRPSG